jgi:Ricin-type beta-trefoil lectin domain-like
VPAAGVLAGVGAAATSAWNATDNPTPRCLDVSGSSTAQNVAMQILLCTAIPGAKQRWTVLNLGDGTVQIRSQLDGATGGTRCLDVPTGSQTQATVLRLNSCTATGRARSWVLEPVNPVVY